MYDFVCAFWMVQLLPCFDLTFSYLEMEYGQIVCEEFMNIIVRGIGMIIVIMMMIMIVDDDYDC